MRLLLVSCLIVVVGCDKAPTPVSPDVSHKPVDIQALGGLLKGQWFCFLVRTVSDTQLFEIWVLEVNTRSGYADQFDYRIVRVFEENVELDTGRRLSIPHMRRDETIIERGNISEEEDGLSWETIEEGRLRPTEENDYGHIVFDKRHQVPPEVSVMGFEIYTHQYVVVWEDELQLKQWDSVLWTGASRNEYDLDGIGFLRCATAAGPSFFLCGYEFGG